MADFYKAFEAIDEDGSGEITVEELQQYMMKNNYKENFVSKWLKLFDDDNCGKITYQHYCDTLGLVPRERVMTDETSKEVKLAKPDSKGQKIKNSESKDSENGNKKEDIIVKTMEKQECSKVASGQNESKSKGRDPKSYPIQVKAKSPRHRTKLFSKHKRNLRANIKPGVILILLTGRHKGKRVVFIKQLESGLLLVTGPYKINGCPLRRVHQKMVIATKTSIGLDKIKVPERVNDSYFSRSSDKKPTNADVSNIFAKTKKSYALKDERKQDQIDIDKQIISVIKQREDKLIMVKYLKSPFSLSAHDCPHKMEF